MVSRNPERLGAPCSGTLWDSRKEKPKVQLPHHLFVISFMLVLHLGCAPRFCVGSDDGKENPVLGGEVSSTIYRKIIKPLEPVDENLQKSHEISNAGLPVDDRPRKEEDLAHAAAHGLEEHSHAEFVDAVETLTVEPESDVRSNQQHKEEPEQLQVELKKLEEKLERLEEKSENSKPDKEIKPEKLDKEPEKLDEESEKLGEEPEQLEGIVEFLEEGQERFEKAETRPEDVEGLLEKLEKDPEKFETYLNVAEGELEPTDGEERSSFSDNVEHLLQLKAEEPQSTSETVQDDEQHPSEDKEQLNEAKIEEAALDPNSQQVGSTDESHGQKDQRKTVEETLWSGTPYLLGPHITDWDDQRAKWLEQNPHLRTTPDGKPRVLMVSGSNPTQCPSPIGDTFYMKSLKLKIDYARIHNYELFYNFAHWDPLFNGYWVKLPLIRNLMLSHPEIEWLFWVDGDVVFTDVVFEAPLETYEGFNWIMQGYMEKLIRDKSWVGINDGVVFIRNCQWTLDLLDKWSRYGPDGPLRVKVGKMLTDFYSDRPDNFDADDQAVLGYLMSTDEDVSSKVKLIGTDYLMSGYWKFIMGAYEESEKKYHPGLGDWRWPWTTHFVGCSLCSRWTDHPEMKECLEAFETAYRFADRQVQMLWGLKYESPESDFLIPLREESGRPIDMVGVNPWAERMAEVQAAATA